VHYTTTSANLASHCEEIEENNLPRTLKDAVDFTRRLGIPFLWIDCVCIIQDSEQDWRSEAMRMQDVYRNATLVLLAKVSKSVVGGLFTPRMPDFPIFDPDSSRCYYFRQTTGEEAHNEPAGDMEELERRKRTFQEKVLPQRILEFNLYSLRWD
jgi:hypothetical protein